MGSRPKDTETIGSRGIHLGLDWNASGKLWHPAERWFVNGALKFDE
jgi:hypothetical protein